MIEAEGLVRRFGACLALGGVDFAARPGEITGLLGPNGAGKTTALRLLATVLTPSAGRARVQGLDVVAEAPAVRRLVGYLPEVAPLYPEMRVGEYLAFAGRARGLGRPSLRARLEWVAARCALEGVWRTPAAELSLGFRQRVGLAQALIHDPPVLILDEPTGGLDPLQIAGIRELLRELTPGRTILCSTHILQEAAALCARLVILRAGRVAAAGTPAELAARLPAGARVRLEVRAPRAAVAEALARLGGVDEVRCLGGQEWALFLLRGADGARLRQQAGELALARGWPVRELAGAPVALEEVFLALAGDPAPEGGRR